MGGNFIVREGVYEIFLRRQMKNMFLYKGTDFKIRLYFLFLNGEKQELLLEEDTIQIGEKNPIKQKTLFKSCEKILTIQKTTQIKQFSRKWMQGDEESVQVILT